MVIHLWSTIVFTLRCYYNKVRYFFTRSLKLIVCFAIDVDFVINKGLLLRSFFRCLIRNFSVFSMLTCMSLKIRFQTNFVFCVISKFACKAFSMRR